MGSVLSDKETKTASSGVNGTKDQSTSADPGWSVPEFKHRLGDNPLWPEFLEELRKSRQADIAESNRLADLEQEELEK